MATGILSPWPRYTVLNAAGKPISGALLNTYIAGTTTPIATYSDVALTVANANPIVANSSGQIGPVFLSPGSSYKFVVTNPDASSLFSQDNISGGGGTTNTDIIGTAGEALTGGKTAYLSDGSGGKTAGLWYLADSANTYSSTLNDIGMVPASISLGVAGTIRLSGQMTGLTSLTIGASYYIGTAGAITVTPPVNRRFVGQADTTSSLVMTAPSFYNDLGLAPLTNGQLIVGSTGAAAVAATLTAGAGISVTNAAGAITITNTTGDVLNRQVTTSTVNNNNAEVTVYSYAVPGGTLSTNKTLHLSLIGDFINNSGSGVNIIIRVKYGATTIYSGTLTAVNTGGNTNPLLLDCELTAGNLTNLQRAKTWVFVGATNSGGDNSTAVSIDFSGGAAGGAVLGSGVVQAAIQANVAEDSTANKNLAVTYQMSAASASATMRAYCVYTELK